MNLDFSEDQKSLRDHTQRFLRETCTCADLRMSLDGDRSFPVKHWTSLCDQGWQAISIPEDDNGLGLGAFEVCVLMEELGRALSPSPFFSTVCLAVETLKRIEHSDAHALLKRIASEGLAVAVDFNGGVRFDSQRIQGRLGAVRDALQAGALLLLAEDAAGVPVLVHVELNAPGVSRGTIEGIDELSETGWIELDGASASVLLEGEAARLATDAALDRAAVFAAFEQIGGAEAACHLAREYSLTRYTFGRPIGGNQAVKHKLADMMVKIELARSNAYYGAWAVANDAPQLSVAAAAARISAIEAYEFAAEECLHLHGGIGYTWEADCHFYYKRARLLALALGGITHWSTRLLAAAH